jgi:hypothetical protein
MGARREYERGSIMNIKRIILAASLGVAVGGLATAGPAGASRCGGMPDGVVVLGDFSTYASPGEVVSYIASNGDRPIVPGEVVKAVCSGAPGGG